MQINVAQAKVSSADGESLPVQLSADERIKTAENLLRQSCEFYRHLDSFSGELKTDTILTRQGITTHKRNRLSFEFKRSGYLTIKSMKPDKDGQVVLNGLQASFYNPKWRTYVNQTLSSSDQVFKEQDFGFVTDGAMERSLIQALVTEDPYAEIMRTRLVKSYDGVRTIAGKQCHQITLSTRGDSCDAVICLSAGHKPWIVQFMPTRDCLLKILPVPVQPVLPTTLTMSEIYVGMRDNPPGKMEAFDPARAKPVKSLAMSSSEDARQSLLDGAAPKFKVRTADGANFSLSKCRNRVVIIEFWATWCPPCCLALPILAQVTNSFSKQDVCFIAVNEKETPSRVKSFFAKQSFKVNVGFDRKGEISQRYRVVGMPQTVVIGRDGKIKFIHVGITSDFKDVMTKELHTCVQ